MTAVEGGAEADTRTAIIALAGAPNVGKSTLLNRILGRPLSITTAKPQTTRTRVLGVRTYETSQLVFTDTPGIHVARNRLHQRMVGTARASVRGADVTCWIVAADRGITSLDRGEMPAFAGKTSVVIINKIDVVPYERVLPVIAAGAELLPDAEFFPLSALRGENVDDLIAHLSKIAAPGPWLYPADSVTDQPLRFFAAELIREQLFLQLDEELPYRVAVRVDELSERRPKTYVEATVFTDSASAKKILVGREGKRIKAIGKAARKSIEKLIEGPAYLQLYVRVRKDWQSDPRFLAELGL